jgi:hypothetical protein
MSARRMVMLGTAGVVAVVLQWDEANKVALVVSAVSAVAAVGVAVWAAVPAVRPNGGIWVSRTGRATGGRANTGVAGPAGSLTGDVRVDRTGDADAPRGDDANTGIRLD